jgi:hypothetical protein
MPPEAISMAYFRDLSSVVPTLQPLKIEVITIILLEFLNLSWCVCVMSSEIISTAHITNLPL